MFGCYDMEVIVRKIQYLVNLDGRVFVFGLIIYIELMARCFILPNTAMKCSNSSHTTWSYCILTAWSIFNIHCSLIVARYENSPREKYNGFTVIDCTLTGWSLLDIL